MKGRWLRLLKEKIKYATFWLGVLIVVMVVGMLILLGISLGSRELDFCGNIPTTLLSGIFGAAFSCFFVLFGFNLNNKSKIIDNQLELRKLFSEEQRWEVHRTLATGDKSYWYKKSGEERPKESGDVAE